VDHDIILLFGSISGPESTTYTDKNDKNFAEKATRDSGGGMY
jgi:hypothetical protein